MTNTDDNATRCRYDTFGKDAPMQTVKISDQTADLLRREATITSRSIAGQTEHWVKLGRAIETSDQFNYATVREALNANVSPDDLTAEEQAVFYDEFFQSMYETSPAQEAFFAQRRAAGLGVGMDESGELVYQKPE